MKTFGTWLFCGVLASMTLSALGQDWPAITLPEEQSQGDVGFVTGGVGHEEASAMRDAAAHWPLVLVFAEGRPGREGWIADVGVDIRDRHGDPVLVTVSDGPFLLARVAPGRYAIQATFDGSVQKKIVTVPATGSRRVVFRWAR